MASFRTSPIPPQKPFSEKKDFLRREEIKTMQKEISKIREEGAVEEREKIKGFEATAKTKRETLRAVETAQTDEIKRTNEANRLRAFLEQSRQREQKDAAFDDSIQTRSGFTSPEREPLSFKEPRQEAASFDNTAQVRPNFTPLEQEAKTFVREKIIPEQQEIRRPPIDTVQRTSLEKKEPEIKIISSDIKKQTEEELRSILIKKRSLEEKRGQLLEEISKLKENLLPIVEKEREIETQKKEIEEKEAQATLPEEKRLIENSRWETEKQRQEIEKERWSIEEDLEDCQKEQTKIDSDYQSVLLKEKDLQGRMENLKNEEQKNKFAEERISLQEELVSLQESRTATENRKNDLVILKNKTAEDLQKISEDEKRIEDSIRQLEERESLSREIGEKRKIEQERWSSEKQRADAEKIRWDLETEINNIDSQLKEEESSLEEYVKEEVVIKNRLQEINLQVGPEKVLPEEPLIEKEVIPENKIVPEIKKVETRPVEPAKMTKRQDKPAEPQAWSKPDLEASASFSYGNIRQKETVPQRRDTLGNEELERRRMFFEHTQELENRSSAVPDIKSMGNDIPRKTYDQSQQAVQPPHKKQSSLEKFWVRIILTILILAILFLVAAFWYWYLVINKQ
jgi:hypothetical protein